MRQRTLGASGIGVSAIGLGCRGTASAALLTPPAVALLAMRRPDLGRRTPWPARRAPCRLAARDPPPGSLDVLGLLVDPDHPRRPVVQPRHQHRAAAAERIEQDAARRQDVAAPPGRHVVGGRGRVALVPPGWPAGRDRDQVERRRPAPLVGGPGDRPVAEAPAVPPLPQGDVGPAPGRGRLRGGPQHAVLVAVAVGGPSQTHILTDCRSRPILRSVPASGMASIAHQ